MIIKIIKFEENNKTPIKVLTMTTLANSTCSTSRLATVRSSSGVACQLRSRRDWVREGDEKMRKQTNDSQKKEQ